MAGGNTGKALGVAMSEPTFDSLAVTGATQLNGNVALGDSASDLIGFYGVTATAQSTAITTFVSGTAATTATYGTPTPDIAALGNAVNSIIAVLKAKGITA